jgi:hypothetical protein
VTARLPRSVTGAAIPDREKSPEDNVLAPTPSPPSIASEFDRADTSERYPTRGDDNLEVNKLERGRDLNRPRPADVTGIKMRECVCLVCEKRFKSMRARDYCSGSFAKDGKIHALPGTDGRKSCLAELERKGSAFHKLTCQNPGCDRANRVFYAKRADANYCGNTCNRSAKRARDNFLCEAA